MCGKQQVITTSLKKAVQKYLDEDEEKISNFVIFEINHNHCHLIPSYKKVKELHFVKEIGFSSKIGLFTHYGCFPNAVKFFHS